MRRAQNQNIAVGDHAVERLDRRIGGDERIGGQHGARRRQQRALEFVAQGGARIVDLGLERHAQEPDRHFIQVVAALEVVDQLQRQPLVHLHCGVTDIELIARESGELHRILEQARAGGEARARQRACARIIMLHRLHDRRVIGAGRFRDHVELVGGGEFDVAIGIIEQLGEFGLDRRNDHDFRRDPVE